MLWTCKNFLFVYLSLGHECVYSPNVVETKYEDNVKGVVFFFLLNISVFSFGFGVGFYEKILNKLKRYYVAMECADLVAFTFAT